MADSPYKIELGIKLDTSDLQSQVNQAGDGIKPIDIKVDAETKELTKTINDALKKLSGDKNALKIDTTKVEDSLGRLEKLIDGVKLSLGTLDNNANTKSLVTSVNQIATVLEKATNESDGLVASLNALAKKDFSVNVGINLSGSNSVNNNINASDVIRNQVIPELQKQEKELAQYLAKHYNTNEFNAVNTLLSKTGNDIGGVGGVIATLDKFNQPIKKGELNQRMQDLRNYINMIKQAAAVEGIDLTPVLSGFNGQADDLVENANNIRNGTTQVKNSLEELKNVFGSGVDAEKLSTQLDSIVTDLNEIKTALQSLSSNDSLDGLTSSFDRLSESIELLVQNANLAKQALGDGLDGAGGYVDDNGTEKAVQDQKELSQAAAQSANTVAQAEEKKQQAYRETADAAEQVSKIRIGNTELDALNLKDDIDEADRLAAALNKLKSIQSSIKNIKIGEIDISKGIQEIQILERQLESLSTEYNETAAKINHMGGVSLTQLQSFQNEIDDTNRRLEQLQSNLREKIQVAIGTTVARDAQKAHSNFDKLSNKTDELRQKLQMLDDIKIDLEAEKEQGDVQRLSELYNKFLSILKEVNTQIDIQNRKQGDSARQQKLDDDILLFQAKIDSWLAKNSAASKQFGSQMLDLKAKAEGCDRVTLNHLEAEFKQVDRAAEAAGKKTQTFGNSLKEQFSKYSSYFSVASLFMYAEQGLRSMFEQVKLIDSAMTELKKVTDETDASYNKFLSNAASRSKELGTTIDGLVSSTADFARLGYGFEDAQGLAEVANIYAVVGDEIEGVEGATESLISTMAAFKDQMNGMSDADFAMSIIDKFNEIGNNFAISSGGIGEALERSASSLMAANATLDESVALITASNQVVQDPVAVGRLMPTLKVAVSVKIQRWTRPRKDFISILNIHQLGRVYVFLVCYERSGIMPAKGQLSGHWVNCEYCGKLVYKTKTNYNKHKHHYCSNECQLKKQHLLTYEDRSCEICGKLFHVSKKSTQRFCSIACQGKWQSTQTGVKNPRFTREKVNCDYCGKEYYIKKYRINSYEHKFCSNDCRQSWYSEIYSQNKEWKEESRKRAVRILENKQIDTNTKPQQIINDVLDSMSVNYINEQGFEYYTVDNYLNDYNLIIEVMGDFWHCHPLKYTKENMRDIHKKRIPRDKAKHTYLKNKYNIEILYLWEDDIYNNIDVCKSLINKYINNNGILENYHSFNYHLKDGKLILNENIILPYQDMVNA